MIDKTLEEKIKKTKDFMDLWMKFHTLYRDALKKESIDSQEEATFLETKSLIARKYQALSDLLQESPVVEDKTFGVVSQILSLQGVSALSDVQLAEIEEGWHNSYLALNKVLGGLENRKEELAKVNPLTVIVPKVMAALTKSPAWKLIKVLVILLIAYIVLFRVFHLGEKLRVFLSDFQPLQQFSGLSSAHKM